MGCPHNDRLICNSPKCESCGWYPPVAKARVRAFMGEQNLYRVPFTGYCEVWANSPEEAAEKAEIIEEQFTADYEYGEPICLEKEEENE